MKLNGILVIPVGETALNLNGMIVLNPVGKVIWECLEKGANQDEILSEITAQFEVPEAVAKEDLLSFLCELSERELIK